jgi:hypothetical protein
MPACPICGADARVSATASRDFAIDCPRCGPYCITYEAHSALKEDFIRKEPIRWAVTSHALRRTGSTSERPFVVNQGWLTTVWQTDRLPNPQQQADYFVYHLGQSARSPDQWVSCPSVEIAGLIGTADDPRIRGAEGVTYIVRSLINELIEARTQASDKTSAYRLRFPGWARFQELRMARVETNVAFMAMGYSNPDVDQAYSLFRTGISRIGVDLRRLDTKPKSGLIDLRMRVDLRIAKFAVADLTDENRGAYWEAGFAEGCGKEVYYTCEAAKFDRLKTHFDTEHLFTVKWDLARMEEAVDELTAAIQNDFPEYAMPVSP